MTLLAHRHFPPKLVREVHEEDHVVLRLLRFSSVSADIESSEMVAVSRRIELLVQ
jgi:hypothetical protein